MANIIINDPSDQQMAKARALWRLQQMSRGHYAGDVRAARAAAGLSTEPNTEVSRRMFKKRQREKALTPTEIAKIPFIQWETVAKHLQALNPTIRFTQLPDGKIAIGFQKPSHKEVAEWEKAALSPEDRAEVQRLGNHRGPRPFVVAASRGWVAPYTDLLSKGMPVEIISRSLKSIVGVLVAHGGFTWDAAERAFGFRLLGPGTEIQRSYLDVRPKAWAETRPVTRL